MHPQSHDPGKALGIVGFILAFLPLQLIGLILSIIGVVQSSKAGHKNGLGIAGIVLNSVFLLLVVPLAAITIVAYNGVTERANTSAAAANASTAIKYSELYAAYNGSYPTTFKEMEVYAESTGATALGYLRLSDVPLTSRPSGVSTITFYSCGELGNKAGYWDAQEGRELYFFSGDATDLSTCTLTTE